MNEVELLQRFRAGLPPARLEARAAARAALLARARGAGEVKRPAPAPLWRRPRLRLALAGVVLAASIAALPIGLFGGGGEVQPAVARVLGDAAKTAEGKSPIKPGPGQFLYTRSKSAYLRATERWSVLLPSEREVWVSFDGSRRGRVRELVGQPRFLSRAQREEWEAAGSPPLPRAGAVEDSGLSSGGFIDASKLPADPPALREMIEAREIPGVEGPPGEAETFSLIGDMLREAYLPSHIRAAIYRLTAELPGVELLGEVRDPAGRAGIGISFADRKDGVRHELILDPRTSKLLGERDSILRRGAYGLDAPPGTPVGYAAYLESKVVDSVGPGAPEGAGGLDHGVGCYDRASLHGSTTVIHDPDPIDACARLWREGIVDTRGGPASPPLVACVDESGAPTYVFPGAGPALCRRLGLEPK